MFKLLTCLVRFDFHIPENFFFLVVVFCIYVRVLFCDKVYVKIISSNAQKKSNNT